MLCDSDLSVTLRGVIEARRWASCDTRGIDRVKGPMSYFPVCSCWSAIRTELSFEAIDAGSREGFTNPDQYVP